MDIAGKISAIFSLDLPVASSGSIPATKAGCPTPPISCVVSWVP